VEPFPDLGSLTDDGLKQLIDDLTKEELDVSYRRRILHGRIDLLRAELQARLQKTGGEGVFDTVDMDKLAAILAGKAAPPNEG
jgi:hypothetical protein